MTSTSPNAEAKTHVQWAYIVIKRQGPMMYPLTLYPSQTGATVMYTLKKKYLKARPLVPWYHMRQTIEDAVISPMSVGVLEAQDYPRLVIIRSSTPLPELTEAFHNPLLLTGTSANFLLEHDRFNIRSNTMANGGAYHAVLIKTEANKYTVAAALVGVVIISIAIGIIVGFGCRNAMLGLVGGAGAIAVFSLIQTFVFGTMSLR